MEEQFPSFDIPDVDEKSGMGVYTDGLINSIIRREMAILGTDCTLASEEQRPQDAIPQLQQKVNQLTAIRSGSTDIVMSSSADRVLDAYYDRKERKGITGIPWPWQTLNEETMGIQKNEFTVLYGRPKSMKTWLLLTIAMHAYDFGSRKVLIYTREMHPNQILDRCACLLARAPYGAFRKGLLHEIPGEFGGTKQDDLHLALESLATDELACTEETGHHKGVIITSDREDKKGGGVMGLKAKVEKYEPDLILVDGVYLMRDDRKGLRSVGWENMTNITQDLHDLALDSKRPLIGTTQANRGAESATEKTMANIAHSDSFAMDCDLAMNVIRPRVDDPAQNELDLIITGAREFDLYGFVINGIPAQDFSQKRKKMRNESGEVITDANNRARWEDIVYRNEYQRVEYRGALEEKRKNTKPDTPSREAEARDRSAEVRREAKRNRQ
jgi:replicative DNA helicase